MNQIGLSLLPFFGKGKHPGKWILIFSLIKALFSVVLIFLSIMGSFRWR
jgi:hypothetical protein